MFRWWAQLIDQSPMIATLIIMGLLAFGFWFLMIYDFPERFFRRLDKNNKDDSDDGGYNIFD